MIDFATTLWLLVFALEGFVICVAALRIADGLTEFLNITLRRLPRAPRTFHKKPLE